MTLYWHLYQFSGGGIMADQMRLLEKKSYQKGPLLAY
jgi:hypothetical protein